jgi:hypothetical protein
MSYAEGASVEHYPEAVYSPKLQIAFVLHQPCQSNERHIIVTESQGADLYLGEF